MLSKILIKAFFIFTISLSIYFIILERENNKTLFLWLFYVVGFSLMLWAEINEDIHEKVEKKYSKK